MSSAALLDKAFEYLKLATDLEEEGEKESNACKRANKYLESASKYYQACFVMKQYVNSDDDDKAAKRLIREKIQHYECHMVTLLQGRDDFQDASPRPPPPKKLEKSHDNISTTRSLMDSFCPVSPSVPTAPTHTVASNDPTKFNRLRNFKIVTDHAGKADVHLSNALNLDEKGEKKSAISEYVAAAELYLESLQLVVKGEVGSIKELQLRAILKRRLRGALDRVEQLKKDGTAQNSFKQLVQNDTSKSVNSRDTTTTSLSPVEIELLMHSSMISSGC